jgi:hypothetical protein
MKKLILAALFMAINFSGFAQSKSVDNLFNKYKGDKDFFQLVHDGMSTDLTLNLPRNAFIAMSFGFLIVLPLLLVGAGTGIWWRRRRR